MKRVLWIVLDSVGCGALPDANEFGDEGSNTLGNISKVRPLDVPNMQKIGIGNIPGTGIASIQNPIGAYGKMIEVSKGKDTTTGHWEMAGVTLPRAFPTYPDGFPCDVMTAFEQAIGTKSLGNIASSGTAILDILGEEHIKTGFPIVYTSADSVFQIAAHEDVIPLNRLYELCEIARKLLVGEHAVGRVIARPFIGEKSGAFTRTKGRRDFSLEPISETILDVLKAAGKEVLTVGKIEDIFAHRGITGSNHAAGNPACIEAMMQYMQVPFDGLCYVNLVDTDMIFGHRRDVDGYAKSLEAFDKCLPSVMDLLHPEDLLIITADHGCDPTFRGSDHTREHVPLLVYGKNLKQNINLGVRKTFADTAATIAAFYGLDDRFNATSYLNELEEN